MQKSHFTSRRRHLLWLIIFSALAVALFNLISTSHANLKVAMQNVAYKGWQNNLQLSNGTVELILTLDVGPRIMRYGYVGEANVFKEFEDQLGKSGEDAWQIRGGHRIWHAPEDSVRTYVLDNSPIKFEKLGEAGVRLIQPVEKLTGIQKEIDVALDSEGTGVTLTHRLRNKGAKNAELAVWALSVMAAGGTAIIPLPEKIAHPGSLEPGEKPDYRGFAPNQNLIVWPFTDLSDPRWRFGSRYITLKQDKTAKKPTKLGLAHRGNWVGYMNNGLLFAKAFDYQEGKAYTDGGSNFETFTNKDFLEVETLSPLQKIAPGKFIEHVERWRLLKGMPNETTEASLDNLRTRLDAFFKK
ncbi:MAG: hypothetical protein ACKVZH_03860 [Blastocatellia bacterium]